MKLVYSVVLTAVSALTAAQALAQTLSRSVATENPLCEININNEMKKIHVWYSLNNLDHINSWKVQVARLYENNIDFYDETCNKIKLSDAIEVLPNSTKKVGMLVRVARSFNSIYSFTGVSQDENLVQVPNNKKACVFVVAPYGPRQMDRMDWRLNNGDCYSTNYGLDLYFK
ncbi:hypothetical protein [Silvanigrella aquatica]|uniref:Uncharacterized protein n=1 Tax=Silvanigrella aquatica TaxID=1915309 RepID=A0A1L4D042_9BACT|nr:hypothetical protein [Silvanigrella aquatica]APJ03571.1 hypothetical protein AXG55_06475 [Silvanigrella aquatica]